MAGANFLNSIKVKVPGYNVFDMSHDVKFSADMGELIPIMVQEVIPGDRVTLGADALVRFAPMIAPVMHRFNSTIHYFFVPNRILWDDWEDFIAQKTSVTAPTVQVNAAIYDYPLVDYIGLPDPGPTATYVASALPFAAYQCVYNEYYRDQNLIAEVPYKLVSGDNVGNTGLLTLRKRAWEHDYFTASLPNTQWADAVDIPIGEGTVTYDPAAPLAGQWRPADGGAGFASGDLAGNVTGNTVVSGGDGTVFDYDPRGTLKTQIEPTTINDLRKAFKIQEYAEKLLRAGRRYKEYILSVFGVNSSDARLQRPEYISGTKAPVIISEVLNTTGEDAGLPQGNMAGHGVSVTDSNVGSFFSEEHGFIIGIMSVTPITAYQQGIPRHFLREDPMDYYIPEFAHIGEQPVYNKELYVQHEEPDGVFGYMPRYAEYRYNPSRVAGDFKTSLNYWHMGRIFETQPQLNADFVECTPGKRIFAVEDPDTDSLYIQVLNRVRMARKIPKFGTPGF